MLLVIITRPSRYLCIKYESAIEGAYFAEVRAAVAGAGESARSRLDREQLEKALREINQD